MDVDGVATGGATARAGAPRAVRKADSGSRAAAASGGGSAAAPPRAAAGGGGGVVGAAMGATKRRQTAKLTSSGGGKGGSQVEEKENNGNGSAPAGAAAAVPVHWKMRVWLTCLEGGDCSRHAPALAAAGYPTIAKCATLTYVRERGLKKRGAV